MFETGHRPKSAKTRHSAIDRSATIAAPDRKSRRQTQKIYIPADSHSVVERSATLDLSIPSDQGVVKSSSYSILKTSPNYSPRSPKPDTPKTQGERKSSRAKNRSPAENHSTSDESRCGSKSGSNHGSKNGKAKSRRKKSRHSSNEESDSGRESRSSSRSGARKHSTSRKSSKSRRESKSTLVSSAESEYNRMDKLLDALTMFTNTDHGVVTMEEISLIDKVYTVALEDATTTEHLHLLAEALHKKWLSKADFPPVAIKIVDRLSVLHAMDHGELGGSGDESTRNFRNIIYTLVWQDYRDRRSVRNISRQIFANAAQFTIEFFANFYWLDEETRMVFRPLIEPLYDFIRSLVDATASEIEVDKAYVILEKHGGMLAGLRPDLLFDIMLDLRLKLIESLGLGERSRAQLTYLIELAAAHWNSDNLPPRVRKLYLTRCRFEVRKKSGYLERLSSQDTHGLTPGFGLGSAELPSPDTPRVRKTARPDLVVGEDGVARDYAFGCAQVSLALRNVTNDSQWSMERGSSKSSR